jgi:hemolysin activation/secretion protein
MCACFMRRLLGALRIALLAASPLSLQAANTVVPGSGTILQQQNPVQPPAPSTIDPGLAIEQPGGGALPPTAPFAVNTIQISGNVSFDVATLHALLADAEGHELTLPELNAKVARITDYYHAKGYPLARALIPAQTIRDGVVIVEVIEARYGKVVLDNHSRVSNSLLQSTLEPLQAGRLIDQSTLDHALLLLSDIPGVVQSGTLAPGESTGTSNLLVQAAPGPFAAGIVTLDNYGNRYTGIVRAGGEVGIYDPLHHGDVLDASISSTGKDMDYGRLSYDALLNGAGTHVGGSYSALEYILGKSLASLDGRGTAQVESAWVKQTLLRTINANLYGQLQFDRKELHDDLDASGIHTDRHLDNWTLSLTGDWRDSLLSGSTNTWSAQWVRGTLNFDNADAAHSDASTARTAGGFSEWNATLARLQHLGRVDDLYLTASSQWSNTNLDPSQKMLAGGAYTVRAYDMSALSGDTGILGSAEWRHEWGHGVRARWQSAVFFDIQRVEINKNTWTTGTNDATLRGAGVSLAWTNTQKWSAKASVASRLGAVPALIADASRVRAWLELSKGF